MRFRSLPAFAGLCYAGALLAGCNAGTSNLPTSQSLIPTIADTSAANAVQNGTFDTGKLSPWTSCGTARASISRQHPEDGRYDALTGSTTTAREVKGWSAICQRVTVPPAATLSAWLYQVTNEPNEKDAYQEVALADAAGQPTVVLEKSNTDRAGWVHKNWDLAKYTGKPETLFFGVYGSGRARFYDTQFVDNVSLTGAAAPVAKPSSLTFSSAKTQAFTVAEAHYTGALTAKSSKTSVATVTPGSGTGPSARFTVTPVGGGSCTITVEDAYKQHATVAVSVDNGIIIIDRSPAEHGGH